MNADPVGFIALLAVCVLVLIGTALGIAALVRVRRMKRDPVVYLNEYWTPENKEGSE